MWTFQHKLFVTSYFMQYKGYLVNRGVVIFSVQGKGPKYRHGTYGKVE